MTQPYLHLRTRGSNPDAIVIQDIDRQLVQIGNPFGSGLLELAQTSLISRPINRVIHWENDIYAQLEDRIYKYNVAANSGDWEVFYDASSWADPNRTDKRSGFWIASNEGVPYLIAAWPLTGSESRFVLIDTSGNITTRDTSGFAQGLVNANSSVYGPGTSWRNKLVFTRHSSGGPDVILYDLKDDVINVIDGFDIPLSEGAACSNPVVYDDRVYIAMAEATTGHIYMGKINGTTLTSLGAITSGGSPSDIAIRNNQWMQLVEVTGCLYLTYCADRGGIVEYINALQIFIDKDTQTVDSVQSANATIPPEIDAFGLYENSSLLSVFARVDNLSGSGVNPIYEFDVIKANTATSENDDRRLYRWNGDMNTPWTFIDAGLNSYGFDVKMSMEGTSENIWTASGTLNVSPPKLEVSGIYINATFKIFGAGQSGVKAQLLVSNEGQFLKTIGTPAFTSHGAINGNQVEGLTADSGNTEYTISWDAANDGVVGGDSPKVAIRVFV